jgi:Rad3-related DNA helicase/serine/threonine protein kinase
MAEVELQQIGVYTVTELLCVSSASTFYQGKLRKKTLLIKKLNVPLPASEDKEAFLLRAKQLKKLKNRNITNVLDVCFVGDYPCLVMEYVAGETLQQLIPSGTQLASDEVKRYLAPAADAIHYAHVNNVLHKNLHPGNLLLADHNTLLLTDFSLALPSSDLPLDDEDFAIPYMAPEHLQGQPTFASDQYALAVMAYEWLCGRRPYEATERDLLLQQQTQATFPLPSSLNSAISEAVERVLVQALSYDATARFPHTLDFFNQYLGALMGFPVKTTSNQSVKPLRSPDLPSLSLHRGLAPTVEIQDAEVKEERVTPSALESAHDNEEEDTTKSSGHTLPVDGASLDATEVKQELKRIAVELEQMSIADPEQIFKELAIKPVTPANGKTLQSIVEDDLRQGGVLSQQLPGYEERLAQIEMATIVAHSLTRSVPAIVEASTGTGKSLAYLLPIVRSGKVAIVSTANKALQEQLFYKDIPFVQKHIKPFEAALVKGTANYVCMERVESERVGMQFYAKNQDFKRLLRVMEDPDSTFAGDFETLGFQLSADIRSRVATDSDQCAWSKCEFFGDCYVRRMRARAERAQVIVVNHTLLLLDAAMEGYLLPERDVIVLDEAHHLEEEATRSFTVTIGPMQVQTLLAQKMLKDHSLLHLQDETLQAAEHMWSRLYQVANPGYKGRVNLTEPLEEGLRLATRISDLADSLRKQRPKNMAEKEDQLYDKLVKRAQNLAENVRMVFSVAQPDKFVYYVERAETSSNRVTLQASAAPLDVTTWLKERLFNKSNVICTSATLATIGPNPARPEEKGPNFFYFRRRIGLDPLERSDVLESILPLTFDYENNALLYLPRDLPEPAYGQGSDDYMKAIAREMYKLVKLSRGRAFLLFSSKRMLDRAYELMSPHLAYPLLKQGDMTRIELTRRFREEEGAVLFGLKSFWEGVDIAGEALSLVVIDKLPFDPPDDPVHEARVAQMKAAGENWFGIYVLPQAVLRLKQGLGRLLRARDDRGVMAILDTRLHTKGYGKMVLNALPPARRTASLRDVERFFV